MEHGELIMEMIKDKDATINALMLDIQQYIDEQAEYQQEIKMLRQQLLQKDSEKYVARQMLLKRARQQAHE